MDHIKLLVKDVFHKIQDIPDIPFTPVRMSEIASRSSPLSLNKFQTESKLGISTCTTDTVDTNTINNVGCHNNNVILPKAEQLLEPPKGTKTPVPGKNKNKLTPLSANLPLDGKGSKDSVCSAPVLSSREKPVQPRIIMGKKALMRNRSNEMGNDDPAAVVHELVNEKFQDKIEHYITRMYHRRQSRESYKSIDDDGASSDYSATSLCTPDSLYDGKSYFSLFFPQKSETNFDFLHSIQDLNKDASDEVFNSTVNAVVDANLPTDVESYQKKFLPNALGDVSFVSQSTEMSLNNSKLQHSQSVDPINGPSLLSRAGTFCSSVRKSLRRACSFVDKNKPDALINNRKDRCKSFNPECAGSTENLMRELYVQNGIIFQVSKALTFCKDSKDFTSPEYIEAEKILLVASCHKESIQSALDAVEFDERESYQTCSGILEISDLVFYIKSDSTTEYEAEIKKFYEYFVIVVTSGKTVLSSQVLVSDNNGEVKSDKKFRLTDLATEFGASIAIYSMKVKYDKHNNSKGHKKDRKIPCPSTKSFFHLNSHKTSRRNLLVDTISSVKPSSFTLLGSCSIRCSDLEKTHFRMHHVPLSSSLEGYFTATLNGDVKLNNRTSGFLTIGFEDKSHPIWNRRWCVLEGSVLKYWNYPSEEFSGNPIGTIDLANATEKSSSADRCICPRPKSLCLLIKNSENAVSKYFLSADNLEEKLSWLEEINLVIGTLTAWKCLRSKEKVSSM